MSTFDNNGITYKILTGLTRVAVARKSSGTYSGYLNIPNTVLGYNVVSIDISACYKSTITSVTFPSTLIDIANHAFRDCTSLTSIDLSICSNLTIIGREFCSGCSSLTSVDFSQCAKLTSFDHYAFQKCYALTYVDLSPCIKLTSMNIGAFSSSAVTTVKFPSSMTSIGSDTFNSCKDLSYVDFSVCTKLTIIRNKVFQSSGIRSVAFPSSLIDMSYNNTFTDCDRLAFITFTGPILPAMNSTCFEGIPTGVKAYMSVAASNNPVNTASKTIMTSNNPPITIQTSFDNNGITYNILGASTVAVGSNLTVSGSVFIPNQVTNNLVTYTVVAVDDNAFNSNHLITSINLSTCSSLTSIGYAAFGNTRIQSFALPSSLTYIGYAGFIENTILTSIDLSNCTNLTSIGSSAFYKSTSLTSVKFPSSLTSINNNVFDACTSLSSINLSTCSSLTTIGEYAFGSCSSLTSVKFPSSLTNVGKGAFRACNISSVDISNCTNLTTIGEEMFQYNINLTSVRFPSSLTTINNNAFIHCYKLQSVIFPENLITIRDATFSYCSNLKNITFTGNSFSDISKNSFYDISSTPVAYMTYSAFNNPANQQSISAMTNNIPPIKINTTNGINYRILDGSTVAVGSNPTVSGAITIPNQVVIDSLTYTVVAVDDNAFSSNQLITSINLSACSSLTTIGSYAFYGSNLTSVNFPSSLTSVGNSAFSYNNNLTSINLSACSSLTTIGSYTFTNCYMLTSVNFPSSLTSVGDGAFKSCSSLTYVDFSVCTNLSSINGYFVFASNLNEQELSVITNVKFPSNIINIGSYMFSGCINLISLDLSIYPNLLTIGDGMFSGQIDYFDVYIFQSYIQSVSFPPNLTSIGNQTFYYCSDLQKITFTGPILPAMNSTCFEGIPTGVKAYMTYNAFNNPVNAAYKLVMTSNDPPITIEILDPPPPPPPQKKKWIGGNRDSSNVVMQRRQNAIITKNNTPGPQTVNTSDNNVRIDALARVRGGGYTVPPKVTGRIINFNLSAPSGPPVDPN